LANELNEAKEEMHEMARVGRERGETIEQLTRDNSRLNTALRERNP
jgi:hypothetical protein